MVVMVPGKVIGEHLAVQSVQRMDVGAALEVLRHAGFLPDAMVVHQHRLLALPQPQRRRIDLGKAKGFLPSRLRPKARQEPQKRDDGDCSAGPPEESQRKTHKRSLYKATLSISSCVFQQKFLQLRLVHLDAQAHTGRNRQLAVHQFERLLEDAALEKLQAI